MGSVTGGNRRIFLFVGQQVRAAAVGDLRYVYTSSEGAGGLARGFALWSYHRIDDAGLHIRVNGEPQLLAIDTVVICAGQESVRDLESDLRGAGMKVSVIGGADVAAEIDAKRAIDQGVRLAASL